MYVIYVFTVYITILLHYMQQIKLFSKQTMVLYMVNYLLLLLLELQAALARCNRWAKRTILMGLL